MAFVVVFREYGLLVGVHDFGRSIATQFNNRRRAGNITRHRAIPASCEGQCKWFGCRTCHIHPDVPLDRGRECPFVDIGLLSVDNDFPYYQQE